MDAKLKTKWVEALRSGKFQQTTRCLRNVDGGGFCCLGVLAEIEGARWDNDTPSIGGTKVSHDEGGWLSEIFSGIPFIEQKELSRMNDGDRKTFVEIADYIEANF